MFRTGLVASAIAFSLAASTSALAAPRAITLEEALQLASSKSPELDAARDMRDAARQETSAANAQLLAQFKVNGNAMLWREPYDVAFGPTAIVIHNQWTRTLDVSAYQPISSLYPIREGGIARREAANAAEAELGSTADEVRLRTTVAYLRLLEAIDLERIASNAVKDIEEQRRIANSLVQAGTLIRLDLTRTEVALADAKQNELHAKAAVGMSAAMLDALVGLPPTTELAPAAPAEKLPSLPDNADAALTQAAKNRPELAAARARAAAAVAGHRAAIGAALPAIGLVYDYQHYDGFGFVQQVDSGFVGGNITWTFWDWGQKFHEAKAAAAKAKAAQAMVSARERDVSLEVTTRFLDAQAGFAAVDVARQAVAQAEEAYRVTRSLYENGNANTTDVLDAELALARARSNDARARFDYQIMYAAFARAAALDGH